MTHPKYKCWFFSKKRRTRKRSSQTPHYKKYRKVAEHIIGYKVTYWNTKLQLTHGRITIRNQRSRWGSCSESGNLNFNYKLIFLPEHLLDYVIVHELCHLQEFNHSPRFWSLVEDIFPDYKAHQSELKVYEKSATLDVNFLQQYRPIINIEPQRK